MKSCCSKLSLPAFPSYSRETPTQHSLAIAIAVCSQLIYMALMPLAPLVGFLSLLFQPGPGAGAGLGWSCSSSNDLDCGYFWCPYFRKRPVSYILYILYVYIYIYLLFMHICKHNHLIWDVDAKCKSTGAHWVAQGT